MRSERERNGLPVQLAGREFVLAPRGSETLLRFENVDFKIGLAEFRPSEFDNVEIQASSAFLWRRGIEAVLEDVLGFVGRLANDQPFDLWPSRVDLAVDVQGLEFPTPDDPRWITRAAHRAMYLTHARTNGIQFGKGAKMMRIYDKSLEIRKSGKSWMRATWESNGAEPCAPVWRVELQARRETLRARGIDRLRRPRHLTGRLDALFFAATTTWLRLHDSTRTVRCDKDPVHVGWSAISRTSFAAPGEPAVFDRHAFTDEQHLNAIHGHLASMAANRGIAELREAIEMLREELVRVEPKARRPFHEKVAVKRILKGGTKPVVSPAISP